MIKTFTENDLLKYLYNELTEEQKKEIKSAIISDSNLQERYNQFRSVHEMLNGVSYEPSKKIAKRILDFSRHSETQSA